MMIQAPRTGRDVEIVSVDYWVAADLLRPPLIRPAAGVPTSLGRHRAPGRLANLAP